jgi:Na+/H+ antiporter NhaC
MYATAWALLPPLIAIILALITKEVYSSLFIGIVIGALFYGGFGLEASITHIFSGGIIKVLSDGSHVGILIFLVLLGTMVALMNKTGGSAAFGRWAATKIKSRMGAQLATIVLGCLIFVDDYFNCLTVGSVMRPVTDKHKISRAKLAYLIDATAAPVCIIAPISSWAAAVSGYVQGEDGFAIFIRTIPYNMYALLTIVMMVGLVILKADYGSMKLHERNAIDKGDIFTTAEHAYEGTDDSNISQSKGKVIDLVLPIVLLVVFCFIGMVYTGGFFEGVGLIAAFSDCDASLGLVLGSFAALVFTIIFYLIRRLLTLREGMGCLPEGFKAMVPAILILVLAWTLKEMTDSLGASEFVSNSMSAISESGAAWVVYFLPAIIFAVGVGLSFSTGTSWGTFGILIPIVVEIYKNGDPNMLVLAISACLAGAVCGDHCSPISDTTIMSSAGAGCNHVNHVNTQLPYALTAAGVSFVSYLIAGFYKMAGIMHAWTVLPTGVALMAVVLLIIAKRTPKRAAA